MARVLLAAYGVKITDRGHEQQVARFGGNLDLLKIFNDYIDDIFTHRRIIEPEKNKAGHRHLSSAKPSVKQEGDRAVYGLLVIGKNGETITVSEYDLSNGDKKDEFPVTEDKFLDREAFFYLHVPLNSKKAYLILQLPAAKGVKQTVFNSFKEYWKKLGLGQYTVHFNSLINARVFNMMMDAGVFKEMTFTKNGIPKDIEKLHNDDGKIPIEKGKVKTTITGDSLEWLKPLAVGMYEHSRKKEHAKGLDAHSVYEFDYEKYTEVSITVDVKGKRKTFHVRNVSRTAPDMDVTDLLPDRWTIDNLLEQAKDLVDSVTFKIAKGDIKA